LNEIAEPADIRLETILKNYSKLDSGFPAFRNEGISAPGTDVNRLFHQNMETALRRGNTLAGVQTRGSANNHHVHGMGQKSRKVAIRHSTVITA